MIRYYDYDTDVSAYNFEVIPRNTGKHLAATMDGTNSRTQAWRVTSKPVEGKYARENRVMIALYQAGVALGAYWQVDDEIDEALRCKSLSIDSAGEDEPGVWEVSGSYEVLTFSGSSTGEGGFTPIDLEPDIEVGSEIEEVPYDRDANGDPVVNAAGDKFDPPLTRPEYYTTVVYTRNELVFSATYANTWKGNANLGAFSGYAEGYVLFRDVTARKVKHPQLGFYWNVTYTFVVRVDADKIKVLNTGYRYKPGGTGVPQRALDEKGQPTAGDILLAANGDKLPDGGTPTYKEFQIAEKIDFTSLNIIIP